MYLGPLKQSEELAHFIGRQDKVVIGLGHRARAGKDEVAAHLVRHYGFRRYAFADLLKQSVNLVTGWGDEHAFGSLKEVVDPNWNISPRQAYQRLGTEGWRAIMGGDVWAKALALRMARDAAGVPGFRAVITDVRFRLGEAELVQKVNGHLVHVRRPGLAGLIFPPKSAFTRKVQTILGWSARWSHQSEYDLAGFDGWDHTIYNYGTLDDLYLEADKLMDLMGLERR